MSAEQPQRAPIRLLVVDDHPLFRRGVTALLATQPQLQVVGRLPMLARRCVVRYNCSPMWCCWITTCPVLVVLICCQACARLRLRHGC